MTGTRPKPMLRVSTRRMMRRSGRTRRRPHASRRRRRSGIMQKPRGLGNRRRRTTSNAQTSSQLYSRWCYNMAWTMIGGIEAAQRGAEWHGAARHGAVWRGAARCRVGQGTAQHRTARMHACTHARMHTRGGGTARRSGALRRCVAHRHGCTVVIANAHAHTRVHACT